MDVLAPALAAVVLVWTAVLLAFARPLLARWREPVLKHPVLILESDDWGAGPSQQALALSQLASLLRGCRDRSGRPAVMSLGMVLEVPDGARMAATDGRVYHAASLADTRFDAVRAAIAAGASEGVFAPQLHGQCHYWPPAVLAAAHADAAVRAWLTSVDAGTTETLPSPLQSRWVDASCLPSQALSVDAVEQAVAAETAAYRAIFGTAPQVAVATTFIWTAAVEAAWARAGIEVVVTPGRRATCRDRAGRPACIDATMLSGDRSRAGPIYLVRDVYFEPALGHGAQRLADGLAARTRQGRACLAEIHRFNFLQSCDASLATLASGLAAAQASCPDVRFLAPLELARALSRRDPDWVETRLGPRLIAWRARLDEIPRFRRLARLIGLALPLGLVGRPA